MNDIILEIVRVAVLLAIVIFLLRAGRRGFETAEAGWKFIIAGFGLLLFGSLLDISDNFEYLNRFVIVGDTEVEAFLEKFVGFLGGFVLLGIGLAFWIPSIQRLAEEIRKRTQIERELQIANDRLETTVEQRTKELDAARISAESANRAKSGFLASMSHEIRTPMNGVLGMVTVLESQNLTPDQRESVHIIKESSKALLDLLNDILDLSKIEAGRIELERTTFSLEGLLDMTRALWESRARAKVLGFEIRNEASDCELIRGDGGRLRQVLFNLISNAVKFTEAGEVAVHVGARPLDGGLVELRFDVRDTGVGLTPDQQTMLFQPFSQAYSSTTRQYGGTGLGLFISKQLVELMGGEIGIESVPGKGSRFWFTIVAEPGEASDTIEDLFNDGLTMLPDAHGAETLRVLAAEDNHINQMVIRALLRPLNCELDIVDNGLKAVQAVRRSDYDIVLMDVQMPEMDGLTATKKIRSLPGTDCDIPIVAITANAMKGDRERYLAAGMNDYISKPIDQQVLFAAIARHARVPVSPRRKTPPPTPGADDAIIDDEAQEAMDGLIADLDEMIG